MGAVQSLLRTRTGAVGAVAALLAIASYLRRKKPEDLSGLEPDDPKRVAAEARNAMWKLLLPNSLSSSGVLEVRTRGEGGSGRRPQRP